MFGISENIVANQFRLSRATQTFVFCSRKVAQTEIRLNYLSKMVQWIHHFLTIFGKVLSFEQKCMCAKMTYEIKDKTNRNKLMIGTSSTSQL